MTYVAIEKHMQKAQDDYLKAVIAERDALRKAAQMALEWLIWLNTNGKEPKQSAFQVQKALSKELK